MKLLKLYLKGFSIDLSREMIYKGNFLVKALAFVLTDFISPIFALLVYAATPGIPGWSFYEFILFQGTLVIVLGLGHLFVLVLPFDTIEAIDRGEFDKFLVKPFPPLLYLLSQSVLVEGVIEFFAGVVITGFAFFHLGINLLSLKFLVFAGLIFLGVLFQFAVMILVSALAFLVVKSEALMNLYFKLSDFARYPLTVYPFGLKLFLIFLFPVAVCSFFPAEILLRGVDLKLLFLAVVPVLAFFGVSVFFWNLAMRKYASAGG
ncbi:hypothetical protein DRJ22_01610 [Candidatus Woesearchaeota archaeon]|nr:MAG: hypothetical protein B6U93_02000 [Candidatus Woesearchaeota archaeon ex4484_78]RLE46551.1 MAG: hypothetical protein DRJ22_01610 [Candidatus Woesearchaeota archaeon]